MENQQKYLAQILIEKGLLNQEQALQCWKQAQKSLQSDNPISFSSLLVQQGYVSKEQLLALWDVESGQKLCVIQAHKKQFYNDVLYCDFHPNGKWIITAGDDGTLQMWDIKSGKLRKTFIGHKNKVPISCCKFSPDGKSILSASFDTTLILWRLKDGKKRRIFRAHSDKVYTCSFSKDGKRLVSGGNDGQIIVWDTKGAILKTFYGHTGAVRDSLFKDKNTIISASDDASIKLWDIRKLENPLTLQKPVSIHFCTLSPNGKIIALLRKKAMTVDFLNDNGKHIFAKAPIFLPNITGCAFSPDNNKIALVTGTRMAKIYNLKTGKELLSFGKKLAVFKGHSNKISQCFFMENGTRILSASKDKTIKIWQTPLETQKNTQIIEDSILTLEGHKAAITAIAVAQDSSKIVSADEQGVVKIWKAN